MGRDSVWHDRDYTRNIPDGKIFFHTRPVGGFFIFPSGGTMVSMNPKFLAWVAVGAVCFAAGAFVSPFIFSAADDSLSVHVFSLADDSQALYLIEGEYPQFPDLPKSFNDSIRAEVDRRLSEFRENSEENWSAREATLPESERTAVPDHPFFFGVRWDAEQFNDRFVSFVLRFDSFEGGANARQELKTFNFDAESGREVVLGDLFPDDGRYLDRISEYVREDLKIQMSSALGGGSGDGFLERMIEEGTEPIAENFSNFVFNDRAITFYFPKYQVAPGAMGEQKSVMARSGM